VSLEREVKLHVPPGFELPDLSTDELSPSVREPRKVLAIYHDTEDLSIVRWGCSLRHREGEGWTVKLPASADGEVLVRGEHVFPAAAGPGTRKPPEEALELVRAFVRGRPVAPVARLQTLRRTVELADLLGRPAVVVTDDEVSVMQGRRVASRFREVEVELAPGAPDELLQPVLDRLLAAGAGPVDNVPKLRRALGPRADAPPDVLVQGLDGEATVAEVVRRALAASVVRLLKHDAGVRLGEDPEEVHQARVATRRLRSDLRTFRDVLEPEWAGPLREELRWLGGELGAVRDAEVLRDRLRGREAMLPAEDRPAAEDLLGSLDRRRGDARARLLEAIGTTRYDALLEAFVGAANGPRLPEEVADRLAAEVLRPTLQGPWKHLTGAIASVLEDPRDENLHAARIRAKRLRYAAEAVAPVFGKRARAFAVAAAGLQDVLGEHQDAVVAGAWLREAGAGEHAFVAGELAALEVQAARGAREAWPSAWKTLSRKRLRFWS
jgi:CHAD domain-containing protein